MADNASTTPAADTRLADLEKKVSDLLSENARLAAAADQVTLARVQAELEAEKTKAGSLQTQLDASTAAVQTAAGRAEVAEAALQVANERLAEVDRLQAVADRDAALAEHEIPAEVRPSLLQSLANLPIADFRSTVAAIAPAYKARPAAPAPAATPLDRAKPEPEPSTTASLSTAADAPNAAAELAVANFLDQLVTKPTTRS